MVQLKLDKIVKEINHYFDQGYQYVFWYDPDGEFADDVTEDNQYLKDNLAAELQPVGAKEQFKIKRKLLDKKNQDRSFLVYVKAKRPQLQFDYFADMERYGHIFSAKASDIVFEQLAEQLNFDNSKRNFVKKYLKYFRAKSRRQTYIHNFESRLINHPELMILSNLAGLDQFDENSLLMAVFKGGMDESNNKIIRSFSKYDVLPLFWQIYDKYFGCSNVRSLKGLFDGAFVTSVYSQLEEKIPSELLAQPFENYSNVQVFMKRFSDSRKYQELYQNLTGTAWNEFKLGTYLKDENVQDLLRVDGIKQIDELLLERVRANFNADGTVTDGDETIGVIDQVTRGVNAFNPEFNFLKETYHVLKYRPRFYDDWHEMLNDYVNKVFKVDTHYRYLVTNYRRISEDKRHKYEDIKRMVDDYYNDQILDQSVREWNTTFQLQDVESKQREQNFYRNFVHGANERIVVLISDAFRYEAAHELHAQIANDDRITSKMNYLLTGLPSVTYMGMPSLLPHHKLEWQKDNVLVDGHMANNADNRRKILQLWDKNNDLLKLDDILKATSKEIKAMIANKNVIYVYHNQVDAIGDNLKTEDETFRATDQAINEIRRAIQVLRTNSVSHIIVTADHGFIYREASVEEQSKIDIPASDYNGKISPRYLMTPDDLSNIPGVMSVKLGISLTNNDQTNVYYPATVNVFKSQGGKNYVHGGSSLQEMVIPVLDMRMNSSRSKAEFAEIRLAATQHSINALRMTLKFNQVEPISDLIRPRKFNIYFMNQFGRVISNVATINANRTDAEINQPLSADIVIQNRQYDRSEDYYLVIDPDKGSITNPRYHYQMNLIND